MKLRLYTRQGVTLMLSDADPSAKNPQTGKPFSLRDLQGMLARGDICIADGDASTEATPLVADMHQPQVAGRAVKAAPAKA